MPAPRPPMLNDPQFKRGYYTRVREEQTWSLTDTIRLLLWNFMRKLGWKRSREGP